MDISDLIFLFLSINRHTDPLTSLSGNQTWPSAPGRGVPAETSWMRPARVNLLPAQVNLLQAQVDLCFASQPSAARLPLRGQTAPASTGNHRAGPRLGHLLGGSSPERGYSAGLGNRPLIDRFKFFIFFLSINRHTRGHTSSCLTLHAIGTKFMVWFCFKLFVCITNSWFLSNFFCCFGTGLNLSFMVLL